jgi:hypothetical protein
MLRIRNVLDKSCRGNQNTRLIFNNIFPKVVPFMRYVKKFGGAREATDNITERMRFSCWITKVTRPRAHSPRNRLLLSHGNDGFAKAS